MNNPLLKYVMKTKKTDVFHSSVFGRAQNGSGVGVVFSGSFSERRSLNSDRGILGGYGKSRIVGEARGAVPRAKQYEKPQVAKPQLDNGPKVAPPVRGNPGISR